MMDTILRKCALTMIGCWGVVLLAIAQPTLTTSLDRNQILIGEQFKLKIMAQLPKENFFVRWIAMPDTLQHFELIGKSPVDSIYTNQQLTGLAQTFTLTSFDSGKWIIPVFNANFNPASGDTSLTLYSDSIPVSVAFVRDTTAELRDIKPIRDAAYEFPIWYWITGAAAFLLLVAIGSWLYLRWKKRKPLPASSTKIPAYQLAMAELAQLKQLDLTVPVQVKQYHSQLALILKQYLTSTKGQDFSSLTTSELLIELASIGTSKPTIATVAAALRCGNAVKFAKFIPEAGENQASLQAIEQLIATIEQSSINNIPHS